jgi:peptidoglycan/xylan/chitin deacetylase (PgdA/CDA1 family)
MEKTMPRMRVLQVAGAMLVVAAFAGCGTAMAADGAPVWSATAPVTSHAARPAVSHSSKPAAGHSAGAATSHSPKPVATPSGVSSQLPASTTPVVKKGSGPAGSLMTTGTAGVALTFDDGPDPVQTPKILDLLAAEHVKATFCLVGQNVAAHPELVRRIVAEGHTVCNHSWNHSLTLGQEPAAAIRADLIRTDDAIRKAAPDAQIKYMRAPGGNFTASFVKVIDELGMTPIYWQVDPRDWDHPAGETDAAHRAKVITAIKRNTHNGSIVLSHDYGQPDTIAAYESLLPWLLQRFHLIALP